MTDQERDAAREKRQARIKEIMGDYPKRPKAYEANFDELKRLLAEDARDKTMR